MIVWPQIWLALKQGRALVGSVGIERLMHEKWAVRVSHRSSDATLKAREDARHQSERNLFGLLCYNAVIVWEKEVMAVTVPKLAGEQLGWHRG